MKLIPGADEIDGGGAMKLMEGGYDIDGRGL